MGDYRLEYKQTSNTSPRSNFGASLKPKGITIHHWGADGQTHSGVVNWLRGANGNTSNRRSSAHYVVSDGLVTQLAADTVATWHSGHRQGNGEDIGIEMRPEMSAGDWDTLVQLCADLEEEHGSLRYRRHSDWKATACPGRYSDRIQELVDAVNVEHKRRGNEGLAKGGKPAPSSGSSSSSGGSSGGSKSVSQMASEVIAGQHGTGHANRRRSLGISAAQYERVRGEVNRRAGGGSSSPGGGKSVAQMAQEVINGQHGNGHANRRRSLGVSQSVYNQVRAAVNQRLGAGSGGSSRPAGKSISQMATEVLRGDHGNGHETRRRSLGVNAATYAKVRQEVNRRA